MIKARQLPAEAPGHWTDDTAMALTIVRALTMHGEIRPHTLVAARTGLADVPAPWPDGREPLPDWVDEP